MLSDVFPLFGLRLRTPLVELRYPTDIEIAELGELAAKGVHDPSVQPFAVPWTDQPVEDIPRAVMQHQWSMRAKIAPSNWSIEFNVLHDGALAGTQGIGAVNFPVLRTVGSGSWLGRDFQGQGIGTHMRAAVLHLAFAGLDAEFAMSEAFTDNPASLAISRNLGYQPNGDRRMEVRGKPVVSQKLRMSRAEWEAARTIPVEIEGLERCLTLLGAG